MPVGFSFRRIYCRVLPFFTLLCGLMSACTSTKYLKENQNLLRRNSVDLSTHPTFDKKAELVEALDVAVVQKPNDYLFGLLPYKLYLYNARYQRYQRDTNNYQLRAGIAQPPVLYDSATQRRTAQNMRGILFGYGLFYGSVQDTVVVKDKKASVAYRVITGPAYAVDSIRLDIRDSSIRSVVNASLANTLLAKGSSFQMTTLDLERRRISEAVRNAGYHKFSAENISFVADTAQSRALRKSSNVLQAAFGAIAKRIQNPNPTVDIRIIVRAEGDSATLHRYYIDSTVVYADYESSRDLTNPRLMERRVDSIPYRYHRYWLRENIIHRNVYLRPGEYFSQDGYDRTITQLGELGVFQSVRVFLYDDDTTMPDPKRHPLRAVVLVSPAARYDFNTNFEVSSGSTYTLGSAVSINLRNRNVGKGANALSLTVSGGIETLYDDDSATAATGFGIRSRNLGVNAAMEFPKFIAPVSASVFRNRNLPRTVVSLGASLLDRPAFFTLFNYTANFTYNWRQTPTNTWDFSPAFISVQQLANESDSFRRLADTVSFIRNTYRSTFIEGENLTFTYSNSDARRKFGYSYLRAGGEEAGLLVSGLRKLANIAPGVDGTAADSFFRQYLKFDIDARHYFTQRHSTTAVRFLAGIGLPYGNSPNLPYIKQYFVGGANSIRGWRVRTLGPGSVDTIRNENSAFIDRTGDIRLEANAEYRFDIVDFFAGAVKIAGATFVDAGNIWLARPDNQFVGGEFRFSKLGTDLAVSSGLGIRFDFGGFITLRLDVGIPVKVPYDRNRNGSIDGWVFDEIDFGYPGWRKQNLIPQIGIGYPF